MIKRSIKLNKDYWDSSSIVHDKKLLKDILELGFCKLTTNADKVVTSELRYTDFIEEISVGGYLLEDGGIKIPKGTSILELGGLVCGHGYAQSGFHVIDLETGSLMENFNYQQASILIQFSGNGYWKVPLPTVCCKLDPKKEYKVYFWINGYNSTFHFTSGFGNRGSCIYARKVM